MFSKNLYLPSEACVVDTMGGISVTPSVSTMLDFLVTDKLTGCTAFKGMKCFVLHLTPK